MINSFDSGREIGLKLCKALGIKSDRVESITLCCRAGEPARVTVCSQVPPDSLDEVLIYASTYTLTKEHK